MKKIFIDSDIETEFNFAEEDFINFMESNKREDEDFKTIPKEFVTTLESLKDVGNNSTEKVFKFHRVPFCPFFSAHYFPG